MNAICDIETAQDVKRLVDAFYAKVNCDELLAPIFNELTPRPFMRKNTKCKSSLQGFSGLRRMSAPLKLLTDN